MWQAPNIFKYKIGIDSFMLSPAEENDLRIYNNLDPKKRAKLNYRVGKKIRNRLSELDEIDNAICSIPQKTATHILDDNMVAAIFKLTEDILKILDYSPIYRNPDGTTFILKSEKKIKFDELTGSDKIVEYYLKSIATPQDTTRVQLLEDHIRKLKGFASPDSLIL